MKLFIRNGETNKKVKLLFQDATNPSGAGLTNISFATTGLSAYFICDGDSSVTNVPLQSGILGTYIPSGLVEVHPVKMPGLYEFGVPNSSINHNNSTSTIFYMGGAPNMVPCWMELETEGIDVASIAGSTQAANNLNAEMLAMISGVVTDANPTTISFRGNSSLSNTDNFYSNPTSVVAFLTGTLIGKADKMTSYTGATRTMGFSNGFPTAPASGDLFLILGFSN